MKDLSAEQKTDTVDSTIGDLLEWSKSNWQKKILYTWSWGSGKDYLGPDKVFGENRPKKVIASRDYENISAKLYESEKKYLFGVFTKTNFIVDLEIKHFSNISNHFVITNIRPDIRLFGKDGLYSAIGKWYTGLK